MDLRAAGIGVFQHGLSPAVFAWIAGQSSDLPSDGLLCSLAVVAGDV
jgi:hypothetical protein